MNGLTTNGNVLNDIRRITEDGRQQAYAAGQLEIANTRVRNLKAKMRKDLPELVSATTQLKLRAADGKRYTDGLYKKDEETRSIPC